MSAEALFGLIWTDDAALVVTRVLADGTTATLTNGNDYALSGDGTTGQGAIRALAVEAASTIYDITRSTPLTQERDFPPFEPIDAQELEAGLDKLTLVAQEQRRDIDGIFTRAIMVPDGESAGLLPAAALRRGLLLSFDSVTGAPIVISASLIKGDPGGNVMAIGLWSGIFALSIPAGTSLIQTAGYAAVGSGTGLYVCDALATAALAAAYPALCRQSADGRYWRAALDSTGGVCVDMAGAAGNGATDDLAAIGATRDYVLAVGGGRVKFSRAKRYYISNFLNCGSNIAWDFNGVPLIVDKQITVFGTGSAGLTYAADVPNDIYGPTNQLPVSTVAGFSVGDPILVRLGTNPWDTVEPRWATSCNILAIDAVNKILTLDVTIPHAIAITYVSTYVKQDGTVMTVVAPPPGAAYPNRSVYKVSSGVNVEINGFTLQTNMPAGQSVEGSIVIVGGHNITINQPYASPSGSGDAGAGLVGLMQFCRNVIIRDPKLGANQNLRNQGSLGRMFNFSNCINVRVYNAWARRFQGCFAFIESFCEDVEFHSPDIEISDNFGSGYPIFLPVQGSEVKIINPTVRNLSGVNCTFVDSGGTDSTVVIQGVFKWRGRLPVSVGSLIGCLFDYSAGNAAVMQATIAGAVLTVNSLSGQITPGARLRGPGVPDGLYVAPYGTSGTSGTGGTGTYALTGGTATIAGAVQMQTSEYAVVDFRAMRTVNMRVPLYTTQYEDFNFEGPMLDTTLYASAQVVAANVGLYLGYDGNNGVNVGGTLVPGSALKSVNLDSFGINYGLLRKLAGAGKVLVQAINAPASGAFVGISAKVGTVVRTSLASGKQAPTTVGPAPFSNTAMSELLLDGVKALDGFVSLTPAALATSAQVALGTVTVPNAAPGDLVEVSPPSGTSVNLWAIVTGFGTATIFASNLTGASVTPPTGEYRITGRKK